MKPTEPIDPLVVKIGRLQRKIEHLVYRLGQSRALNEHYKAVMNVNPMLDYRFDKYTEMKAERERVKGLEARIKEQAALIALLQKDNL
jgi:hypothetical protein